MVSNQKDKAAAFNGIENSIKEALVDHGIGTTRVAKMLQACMQHHANKNIKVVIQEGIEDGNRQDS